MNFSESEKWMHYAAAWTPGASQTGSKAPGKAGPMRYYPMFLQYGRGCEVCDIDNNVYVDMIASLAAVGLGHANAEVNARVVDALHKGSLLSLPTKLEGLASEMLCQHTRWATSVRWVKTGSESTEAAVRIARAATGRSRVLTIKSGYHSWHAWFQAVKPMHPGVPDELTGLITGCDYGDSESIGAALEVENYACVILEPAPITGGGSAEFLHWLLLKAHAHGTLVIFDEVVWGFRLAPAGATQFFGVRPDLACYGKAMGNGIPVAAVVGSTELMKHAALVSGTFGGDALGLAAAMAVMDIYGSNNPLINMWERGRQFQERLHTYLVPEQHAGISFHVTGYPVHPVVSIDVPGVETNVAMSFLLQQLARRGVLYHPAGGNIIACMSKQDMDRVTAAFELALYALLSEYKQTGTLTLEGEPYQQAFSRART